MATIQDIARMSGCSIGTVSRVINNRTGVSKETREKVEAVIREQDYRPNSNARMLRQAVSPELSVIVRGVSNTFLQSTLEMIQIRLHNHGESASVEFIRETEDEVEAAIQLMQSVKPKGFIFLGGSVSAFREGFSKITVPSVLITANAEGLGFGNLSSFTTDDREAAARVVGELVSQGHRRIGIIGGYEGDERALRPEDAPALRITGAIEALEQNGIAFDIESDYEVCPFSSEGGYEAAKRLLSRSPDLTGVFAISDAVAIGAMRAFRDMGLHVPNDMSVVGFDGIAFSNFTIPRLATIQQDAAMLATRGVDDLLMRISYGGAAVHERIAYRYVHGESVARPRETDKEGMGRWQH